MNRYLALALCLFGVAMVLAALSALFSCAAPVGPPLDIRPPIARVQT